MKDIPSPHLLLKFYPKKYANLQSHVSAQKLYVAKKTHAGPLGVNGEGILYEGHVWYKFKKSQKVSYVM